MPQHALLADVLLIGLLDIAAGQDGPFCIQTPPIYFSEKAVHAVRLVALAVLIAMGALRWDLYAELTLRVKAALQRSGSS